MADIEIKNLTKKFDDFTAVQSSSFKINNGEFFVMLGPSGCGKTTTLRMIAGLEIPTSGKVLIDGEDVSYLRASQRDIAFVFQMFALYPHMSVEKNISFPLRMQHVPRKEIKQRVLEVAETLRIKHILKKSVNGLSGGDRQRVALGRALVRKPKVFLMDEPLGALDAKFRELMCEELLLLHKRIDATTVYVTHDQIEAMSMADRICVMNHAKILQIGKPLDIYRKPATSFVAGFIGTPAINFITAEGNLKAGQREIKANGVTIEVPMIHEDVQESSVILGVRPEYIKISDNGNIDASILSIEYLGARQLLRVDTVLGILTIRMHSNLQVKKDEKVKLKFDTPNLMLFNPKSDKAVKSDLYKDENV